ncbi:MAG TPA: D-sedoheptulose 7-phosphate isomerase [Xanthobacteraceae bacterium]|jgi:D-sedoheptulose 7-phosphate isomerase|nr:D-sedoheptulose 7-phosphate isomerase [Xanthobacteraceae bacterium]
MNSALDYVRKHLTESLDALAAAETAEFAAVLVKIADTIAAALKAGGKVMLCGNGGSAADAQHIAAELLGRYEAEREPLAALALTTDTSALTAIGNDYGFEHVFSRQVRGLGRKGDVLVGLSTSGKSPNVLAALDAAREMGIAAIGFTGKKGGDMSSCCDIVLNAPSDKTAVIQQIHLTAAHIVCGLVERGVGAKR